MVGIIIQARLGSTRLPGKIMYKIDNKPLLQYCVDRCKQSRYANKIIVATTENMQDNEILDWCDTNGLLCFRGSEKDVLDRYYKAAVYYGIRTIVRVTSDCPFVDPMIIDLILLNYHTFNVDYASNRVTKRTWPHGLDIEVLSFDALEIAWKESNQGNEREHVTPYIYRHPEKFKILEVPLNVDLSDYRLTVDYSEDIELVETLILNFNANMLHWPEIIKLLKLYPTLVNINCLRKDIAI